MEKKLTFDGIKNNPEIRAYLEFTDAAFAHIGYKEHGRSHAEYCADVAEQILKYLGYSQKDCELGKIAAYLHDIGNIVSTRGHEQSGAVMFLNILNADCYDEDAFAVASAIGCHEDKNTPPVSNIAAALVLGDKTDVRSARIRTEKLSELDKHSKVLAACRKSNVVVNKDERTIGLHLTIDTEICPVMDYFEIFTARTKYCIKASRVLNCEFELFINKDKFL